MSERIPKIYAMPNHPIAATDYMPPRTTDPLEADRRRANRGKHVLILEEQAQGLEVAQQTLRKLRGDDDVEAMWAGLAGGTMLMSANYLFNSQPNTVMYHNLRLPDIASVNPQRWMSPIDYDELIEGEFEEAIESSNFLAGISGTNKKLERRIGKRLGRTIGELGVALAEYPLNTGHYTNAADIQARARRSATVMHNATIALGQEIETVPSVSQFAHQVSPLGFYIMNDRSRFPDELRRAFAEAQEKVADEQESVR